MKDINLGYLHIVSWKEGDRLFGDWMYEEEDYAEEIEDTPADEVILPANTHYKLKITYPLSNPFIHNFTTGQNGMMRKELVKLIVDSYHKIYDEEDESVGHKTGNIPGMYNRQSSDGKYGIWGHSIDDLMIGTAHIKNNVIELSVDS